MLEGIDVASWQGTIDWGAVRKSGITFAYIKATEGTTYKFPEFALNVQKAREAGVIIGAYHFARPDASAPDVQAKIFVDTINKEGYGPGWLPAVLDWENAGTLTVANANAWAVKFASEVERLTGKPCIFYMNKSWSTTYPSLRPLWLAWWTDPALNPVLPDNTLFWQYTNTGSVPGIVGNVDRNKFLGTLEDLQRLAQTSSSVSGPLTQTEISQIAGAVKAALAPDLTQIGSVLSGVDVRTATLSTDVDTFTSEIRAELSDIDIQLQELHSVYPQLVSVSVLMSEIKSLLANLKVPTAEEISGAVVDGFKTPNINISWDN